MNKNEEHKILNTLFNKMLSETLFWGFLFGFIIWVYIKESKINTIQILILLMLVLLYICVVGGLIKDCIKINQSIKKDNYTYHYIKIDSYQEHRVLGLYAKFIHKGKTEEAPSSTRKATMVHVFDCNGTIVAKVEEEKDLLQ